MASRSPDMKLTGWGSPSKEFDASRRPKLLPWIERTLGASTVVRHEPIATELLRVTPPQCNERLRANLLKIVDVSRVKFDSYERLIHSFGKSYRDLLRIRRGDVPRAPDLVVYPTSHDEVQAILECAAQSNAIVIPFGGGTNIVGSVEAISSDSISVLSLDMRLMNRCLSIDTVSRTARFEAGIRGPDIESALNSYGMALGHEPDSFEYSTLGGWIATRSAGMQSNEYGKIENLVLSMKVVTPSGGVESLLAPASAAGPDLRHLFFGTEGTLGVITEAVVQIHARPEIEEYRAVLFPSFENGVLAARECTERGSLPSLVRLLDEDETDLSFAMKPKSSLLSTVMQAPFKTLLRARGYSKPSLMILGYQGDREYVERVRSQSLDVFRQHRGIHLGKSPGQSWLKSRYELPYLRDLVMDFSIMVDVSETATTWSNLLPLYQGVKSALTTSMQRFSSRSYVGCHVSHIYPTGACLYFTFASRQAEGRELEQYQIVKSAACEAIVKCGGTLSHHHAIGYEHKPWLSSELGSVGIASYQAVKQRLDPKGILNPGKCFDGASQHGVEYAPLIANFSSAHR